MKKNNVVEGFYFEDEEEYVLALKEHETISYIEEKLDKSNGNMVLSVYNKLALQGGIKTIVGKCYLNNLYNIIIENNYADKKDMFQIAIKKEKETVRDNYIYEAKIKKEVEKNKKLENVIIELKNSNSKYKFVSVVFAIVIIIVFIIANNSSTINYTKTKDEILDDYSSWEKELKQREDNIKEFEMLYGEELEEYLKGKENVEK